MKTFSLDILKTIIEINSEINSDYSNKDALLFQILNTAMRLINCERSYFVAVDGPSDIKIEVGIFGDVNKKIKQPLSFNPLLDMLVNKKQTVLCNSVSEDAFYYKFFNKLSDISVENVLIVPFFNENRCLGVITLINKKGGFDFTADDLQLLKLFCDVIKSSYLNAEKVRQQLNFINNVRSNQKSVAPATVHNFIAESPVIKDLMNIIKKAAITNSSILLTGESGVGKEIFAEQIYVNSHRVNKPFVRVNCAALSETLMESELFGHVKGAFTSAVSDHKGRFEMADGGTIFLDEVGELPLSLQPKLLRVIQDKQFERVGSSETINVDVRIIAATNRNLEEMVRIGKFREDLFFRLNVLPIRVPPLRARPEDILPMAEYFLGKYSAESSKNYIGFSDTAIQAMKDYYWPGNIRELDNAVARACIIGSEPIIQKSDLRLTIDNQPASFAGGRFDEFASVQVTQEDKSLKTALNAFKRSYLIQILEECNWNQTKACKVLGIQRTYVSRLMNELHIRENNGK